jgi:hypothetical protein
MILIYKYRAPTTIAAYTPFACVSELTGGREVEQEGVTVTNKITEIIRFPLSFGEASYAVPIFDLK